jgi:hypothetical protein
MTVNLLERHSRVPLVVLVALLTPLSGAEAYLDPGTGSLLLQLLLAGFLGALFTVRRWAGRVVFFFRRSETAGDETKPVVDE